MYALVSILFSDAGNSIGGTGQAHTVYGAAPSVTKAATQTKASRLRGARVVRYWFNDARPDRPTQSYAGLAR